MLRYEREEFNTPAGIPIGYVERPVYDNLNGKITKGDVSTAYNYGGPPLAFYDHKSNYTIGKNTADILGQGNTLSSFFAEKSSRQHSSNVNPYGGGSLIVVGIWLFLWIFNIIFKFIGFSFKCIWRLIKWLWNKKYPKKVNLGIPVPPITTQIVRPKKYYVTVRCNDYDIILTMVGMSQFEVKRNAIAKAQGIAIFHGTKISSLEVIDIREV